MTIRLIFFTFLLISFTKSYTQTTKITISGSVKDAKTKSDLAYVNVVLKSKNQENFIAGTITNNEGRFSIVANNGEYILELSMLGFQSQKQEILVGKLSPFLDLGIIELKEDTQLLKEVVVSAQQEGVNNLMDKKSFSLTENISQSGGSVLQAMRNLPGITTENGKIQLRGSDKVAILIDGKQTAMSGFGNQASMDNIPASAIEKIEIINNPSSKYDANGNAGIINIIYKKNKQEGFNGKIGLMAGLGALWVRKENLPTIRPQYQQTPKINPSLSLNYRKNKVNLFVQGDYLLNYTLNRNDFNDRTYTDGTIIRQQAKRNRITRLYTAKLGLDWNINDNNTFTVSGYYSNEWVRDYGDIPYFNANLTERKRLWQFFEDETNYAATATATFQHKFKQPGRLLNIGLNYTFHREDEKYFLTNIMPTFTGKDDFALIADENVFDFNFDYIRPLKHGRIESGVKVRRRFIPTIMNFFPGQNSPLDVNAAGWANYGEIIPALYSNYVFESKKFELEAGLRLEYVDLEYSVIPSHNTYKSDGYSYFQPFPSVRLGYNINPKNKISFFYNRRVDRPDEGDIRIFPKYDEPEILKVGNPTLKPQFTNTIELGYKTNWSDGYFYSAFYHKIINQTISRIGTLVPNSTIIYNIFQNADRSFNSGIDLVISQFVSKVFSFNINANIYKSTINGFTITNKYPIPTVYTAPKQSINAGNLKFNGLFNLPKQTTIQLSGIYLAPDIIPQGKIGARYSMDLGIKKQIQKGKGELFLNGNDIFNTLIIKKEITGNGFSYQSTDYLETQVFKIGYGLKF